MSAPANLQPNDDIGLQGTTVNWVGEEPRCVCDNYQQAMHTRAALRFLLQPMQYSPVCGHTGSQCFDEGDRSNLADRWFHGTRVGTRVGHTGPGYPSTRVLTSLHRTFLSILQLRFGVADSALNWFNSCLSGCTHTFHLPSGIFDSCSSLWTVVFLKVPLLAQRSL